MPTSAHVKITTSDGRFTKAGRSRIEATRWSDNTVIVDIRTFEETITFTVDGDHFRYLLGVFQSAAVDAPAVTAVA